MILSLNNIIVKNTYSTIKLEFIIDDFNFFNFILGDTLIIESLYVIVFFNYNHKMILLY